MCDRVLPFSISCVRRRASGATSLDGSVRVRVIHGERGSPREHVRMRRAAFALSLVRALFFCHPPSFLELLLLTSFLFYFGAGPRRTPPEPADPLFDTLSEFLL